MLSSWCEFKRSLAADLLRHTLAEAFLASATIRYQSMAWLRGTQEEQARAKALPARCALCAGGGWRAWRRALLAPSKGRVQPSPSLLFAAR